MCAQFNKNDSNDGDESTLAYDLRQRRAKIIGDCIEDVVEAAKMENYYGWLKNLDDLYTISVHTFKDKETIKKDYGTKRNLIVTLANKHKEVWLKRSNDSEAAALIESALRDLFEFVMNELEEAKIFGSKLEDEEGL